MDSEALQTPVALFVFNRLSTAQRVFEAIAEARPTRLLLIADGFRPSKAGEKEVCEQVREVVSRVNWPCEVSRNFADSNLGCQERIISGLNWVFSLVEEAIILEDDCLPDRSFFPFCQELLERYRGDSRVVAISGTNLVGQYLRTEYSYFFSLLGGNWGWATWRSEWQLYDRYMEQWPALKRDDALSEVFEDSRATGYWTRVFDDMYENKGRSAWDYQWLYTRLKNNGLTIVPRVNLVANIGFGEGATHTSVLDNRLMPSVTEVRFPLIHPPDYIPLRSMDRHVQNLFRQPFTQRFTTRIRSILRRIASRV